MDFEAQVKAFFKGGVHFVLLKIIIIMTSCYGEVYFIIKKKEHFASPHVWQLITVHVNIYMPQDSIGLEAPVICLRGSYNINKERYLKNIGAKLVLFLFRKNLIYYVV